jgi:hypothetical protein
MSDIKISPVVSMSGSPILRHGAPTGWRPPQHADCLEQIADHIATHLGQVETIFQETLSDTVHIDVHLVTPTAEFPYFRLITSGMSGLPMSVPDELTVPRHVELLITLPGHWKLDLQSLDDETWYWPVRLLKTLARLPHKHNTWLGWGHSVHNGEPTTPYAPNTLLSSAVVLPSVSVPDDFHTLSIAPEKSIRFFAVVPIYQEELNLKLRSGLDVLLDEFDEAEVTDIVDPQRTNVALYADRPS